MLSKTLYTDFLIIGSGLAGLNAAYHASKFGRVTIISSIDVQTSNSWLAQGGIAVVMDQFDSNESHISDTLEAGRELCDYDAVDILVKDGKEQIQGLIELGMQFDRINGALSLGMEGGHSTRRILHADGSSTGRAVTNFLFNTVRNNENVEFLFNTECIELIRIDNEIVGSYAYDEKQNLLFNISASYTIMSTGGYSGLFRRTTNNRSALGQGISLAMNAGAIIRDMEFIQFHPTAFFSQTGHTFLISEAVRGEGAYLLNEQFERFMVSKYNLDELAPRDIISKAIYKEIQNSSLDYVYLDLRHLNRTKLKNRFKNIVEQLEKHSLDISKDLIPVSPAAHYSIGGIETDLDGKTSLERFYACGEVTSTGVHGANRLASNSLLECVVFSARAVYSALNNSSKVTRSIIPFKTFIKDDDNKNQYAKILDEIKEIFSNQVGIVRDESKLIDALNKIENLSKEFSPETDVISEIKMDNLLKLSSLIIKSAIVRKESRGTHQRSDYPSLSNKQFGHYYSINSEIYFEEKKWKLKKSI